PVLRVLISILLVTTLAACHSVLVDPAEARASMLRDLGLDPSAVVHEDHVRYAIGARPAAFKSGLYVQTRTDLYLYRHGKALEPDVSLALAKLEYARVESWSFTHLKQLQLGSPSGMIVVNFHDQPDAMAGDGDRTQAAYSALVNEGVRSGAPSGR